jgi:hypothetical protein
MFRGIIHRLLEKRHFWRVADFDELAELYVTRMLRTTAVGMVSVFVAIYLLQNGYSVLFALLYFAISYFMWSCFSWPSMLIVAALGPKHGTLISNLLYIPALLALTMLPHWGLPALVAYGFLQAASVALYDISYYVNLSKVKHVDHAGKELGFLYIMEKIGMALSPLLGGVVASVFGAEYTLFLAAGVFAIAAAPLFFTPEPTKTHQKATVRHLNWPLIWRNVFSNVGAGGDMAASGPIWSLFLAVVVFAGVGSAIYAQVGALASITLLSAIASARIFGLLIDRRRGRELLLVGVFGNSALHLIRPFITGAGGVVAFNMANELATTGYKMPYIKAMCDTADDLPGYRIAYLSVMSSGFALGGAMLLALSALAVYVAGDIDGLKWTYVLAGLWTLSIAYNGFRIFLRQQNPIFST